MKLCIHCKYYNIGSGEGFERCNAPQNIKGVDPVNGEKIMHWTFCESLRKPTMIGSIFWQACGKHGRWFEPKEVHA